MLVKLIFILFIAVEIIENISALPHKPRLAGATQVKHEQHLYFSTIYEKPTHTICGGVIISEKHILSTGYCLKKPESNYTIYVGDIYYGDGDASLGLTIKTIRYSSVQNKMEHLAIAELETSLKTIKYAQVSLPSEDIVPRNNLVVMGFGSSDNTVNYSDRLMEINLKIIPNEDDACVRAKEKFTSASDDRYFCARSSTKYLCVGDEGDPMVEKEVTLRGIASNQFGCLNSDRVSVFYNVMHYIPFIDRIIRVTTNRLYSEDQHNEFCTNIQNGKYNWFDMSAFKSFYICFENKCENNEIVEVKTCIPFPLSPMVLITSKSCIQQCDKSFKDSRTYKDIDKLKVKYESKSYSIVQFISGQELLPFFTQEHVDTILIMISEPLNVQKGLPIFNVLPALDDSIAPQGILYKYFSEKQPPFVGISVKITKGNQCSSSITPQLPFKLTSEMFCVTSLCDIRHDYYNVCAPNDGAPVFDAYGNLVGLIIFQKYCKDEPSIGIRISKFVRVFRENKDQQEGTDIRNNFF